MKYYFRLQYLRVKRDLANSGINTYLGIGLLIFAFIFFSELILNEKKYGWKLYPIIAALFITTFSEKERNQFLKSIFPLSSFKKIRQTENLAWASLFAIFLLVKGHFVLAIGVLFFSYILSKYDILAFTKFQIPSPFSKYPYEFTVGFRRTYWLIGLIYISSFMSIYYHFFYFGLFSLLSIYLFCLSFYSELDPIFYVWIHSQPAKSFLKKKIRIALMYSSALSFIIFVPMLIFYSSHIILILSTMILGLLYLVLGISAVYSNFPVKKTMSQNFQFYLGITIPPLLVFIIPNLYYQAVSRLKEYLKC